MNRDECAKESPMVGAQISSRMSPGNLAGMKEMELKYRIDNDFSYHNPTSEMLPKFRILRDQCKSLAHSIRELVPEGRERETALVRLEEVMMHSNAGIARRGTTHAI